MFALPSLETLRNPVQASLTQGEACNKSTRSGKMLVEYDLSPQQIASHTNMINNDNLKHGNHSQPRNINIHHQTYNALRLWHRRSKMKYHFKSCKQWKLQGISRWIKINQALKSPVPPGNGADNGRQQPAASASAARGERRRRLAAMSNQGHVNLVKFPKGRDICEHLHGKQHIHLIHLCNY